MKRSYKIGEPLDPEDADFYRGTHYHFNSENQIWWRPSKEAFQGGLKATVTSNHSHLLKKLRKIRPEGGSFRITENNIVLTKIKRKDGNWVPVFVDELETPFQFKEKIENLPINLEPGDLWPSFYDGSKFSSIRSGETKVWFRQPLSSVEGETLSYSSRRYVEHNMPKGVEKEFSYYKGQGGSFRITENGYVITLISPQPLSDRLKEQWDNFSDTQQRLIEVKVEGTQMLPIFLGIWESPSIKLKPSKDYSRKLGKGEKEKMLDFLSKFEPTIKDEDEEVEIETEVFWDDPEDFASEVKQ